jgi:arabinogalactan endo-1,4-beta-galactosidase
MATQFRMALSLGQEIKDSLGEGVSFQIGTETANTMADLQKLYANAGSTEMFVRIATKRYNDSDDYHAKIHNLEAALDYCRVAASLDIPINPEIMCAYTYMDGNEQQAPNFDEYPELNLPDGDWSEYNLSEMCGVLTQYGELVAGKIKETGCRVEYFNLGNESNFGFAGVSVGLKTAVSPILETKTPQDMYYLENSGAEFLKENLWNYSGQLMRALADGLQKVYPEAKFGTHIAGLFDDYFSVSYYKTLSANGMDLDEGGISIYPTSEMSNYYPNYMDRLKDSMKAVLAECGIPVFVAEYGYPSAEMGPPYDQWNVPVEGYGISEDGQARYTADFIQWCKENGSSGIRPWGPDVLGGWEPMSLFQYDESTKTATAKSVIEAFQ